MYCLIARVSRMFAWGVSGLFRAAIGLSFNTFLAKYLTLAG
jgi:hypothetical protein